PAELPDVGVVQAPRPAEEQPPRDRLLPPQMVAGDAAPRRQRRPPRVPQQVVAGDVLGAVVRQPAVRLPPPGPGVAVEPAIPRAALQHPWLRDGASASALRQSAFLRLSRWR